MLCRLGKDSVSVIKVIAGSDSYGVIPYIRLMMITFRNWTDDYGLFQ